MLRRLQEWAHDRRVWLVVIAAWPLTVAAHQLALLAGASVLTQAAALPQSREALTAVLHDDVYARLILAMVGNTQLRPPQDSGWLPLVFQSGTSAVGAHILQVMVNALLVAIGAVLLAAGVMSIGRREGRRPRAGGEMRAFVLLAAAGMCLACGAGAEMRLPWSSGSGGEMALSMVATKVLGVDSSLYDSAMHHGAAVSLATNAFIVAVVAGLLAGLPLALHRLRRRSTSAAAPRVVIGRGAPLLSVAAILMFGWSAAQPNVAFERTHAAIAPVGVQQSRLAAIVSRWPSVVTVTSGADGRWAYAVNGQQQTIQGIGYNAITVDDTPAERGARYDQDFEAISATGANTIVGWSEREFDDVLMDKAAQHGLGVILPFELDASFAYEDPRVRAELLDAISRRVEHFRDSPALRMWGLGNEVLHEIARARGSQARWDAFSPFLIEAADRIHQLDPNHPVVYRDAEDWYAEPVVKALASSGKTRPWFVYSMNFFTTRMDQALTDGREVPMHQALMISEYGPVGLRPDDRPGGYAQLWDIIRRHQDRVLGGLAYVWTTAGPEPLDRNFGLTDAVGNPVDGALAELEALYSGTESRQAP